MVSQWRCNFSTVSDTLDRSTGGLDSPPGKLPARLSLLLADFWQGVTLQWEKNFEEK